MITRERLHELFDYRDGHLYHKQHRGGIKKVGDIAGSINSAGYICIRVDGKKYLAHRLIWLMTYGVLPEFLDHINGIKTDNRWCNLRIASKAENNHNAKLRKDNTSGVKGVSFIKQDKKWKAEIMVHGVRVWREKFNTLEEATQAIQSARMSLHKEFANHG